MARYKVGIETRGKILTATRLLLGEVGFEGTTLKAICDRAGIQSGSFYNLFPSKDEAILTVLREAITAVDPDPAGEGKDTVAELVEAYVGFVGRADSLARIYVQLAAAAGTSDGHLKARVLRHHEQRIKRFADALRRERDGLSAEQSRREAEMLVAMLNGMALHWSLDPSFDLRAFADQILTRRLASP